jgi:hypothetical protein
MCEQSTSCRVAKGKDRRQAGTTEFCNTTHADSLPWEIAKRQSVFFLVPRSPSSATSGVTAVACGKTPGALEAQEHQGIGPSAKEMRLNAIDLTSSRGA